MPEENAELVRQFLATFIEVDEGLAQPDRLYEFYAPGAPLYLEGLQGVVAEERIRGVDEFLEWRVGWIEPYDDWSYDAEKILDGRGNRVAVTFHQRGKLRGTDDWIEMRYGIVYTVEKGLITEGRVYLTPEEALEAAGLSE
jgi:hypothetical protein